MARKACGFVVFRRISDSIEYLLLRANYRNHHWSPPKGHVKERETEMQTALRETEEEAGFVKEDLKIYENIRKEIFYNVNGKPKKVIYWLAELIDTSKEVTLSNEHQDFKWLPLGEALEKIAEFNNLKDTFIFFDNYISEKKL